MQPGVKEQVVQVLKDPTQLPAEFLNYIVQYMALNQLPTGQITIPATVTQGTSKTTGVTLNATIGQITTHNAALAANTRANFVVTNSEVTANKPVVVSVVSPSSGTNTYTADVIATAAQSFTVSLLNLDSISQSDAVVLLFRVLPS